MIVAIIDYGLGNLGSIRNMLVKLGVQPKVADKPNDIASANLLILPGVGAFDAGMMRLRASGLVPLLNELVLQQRRPVMGICLGMQLMTEGSEEGQIAGLGWVPAKTIRFTPSPPIGALKVPHMGWNTIRSLRDNPLLPMEGEKQCFYFVHSYKVVPDNPDIAIANCCYGGEFCAAFQQGNIFGVQFHPEKSHKFGMNFFKKFVDYYKC